MYFHTDDPDVISKLADVLITAKETNTRVRIKVDGIGGLYIKRGEGMWSAPIDSTPDPYRDNS